MLILEGHGIFAASFVIDEIGCKPLAAISTEANMQLQLLKKIFAVRRFDY